MKNKFLIGDVSLLRVQKESCIQFEEFCLDRIEEAKKDLQEKKDDLKRARVQKNQVIAALKAKTKAKKK